MDRQVAPRTRSRANNIVDALQLPITTEKVIRTFSYPMLEVNRISRHLTNTQTNFNLTLAKCDPT